MVASPVRSVNFHDHWGLCADPPALWVSLTSTNLPLDLVVAVAECIMRRVALNRITFPGRKEEGRRMVKNGTEAEFGLAMRDLYNRALEEAGYPANIFLRMLGDNGPLDTARILLHKPNVSDGYTELWRRGRLDLTLEALVLQPKWRFLFSPEELQIARRRLREFDYEVPETPPSMAEIADELDRRARNSEIGELQKLRQQMTGSRSISARGIFSKLTIKEEFAFHHGGRSELQFNIGFEHRSERVLRHGVAFSLEPSQGLPDPVATLLPYIERFNEFLRINPDAFPDMAMWHFRGEKPSSDRAPTPITPELVDTGIFIFLGKRGSADRPDYDLILSDFERLLWLYRFVQTDNANFPMLAPPTTGLAFRAGHHPRPHRTISSRPEQVLEVSLRHNRLQEILYRLLSARHGAEHVGTEQPNGPGNLIDVVVKNPAGDCFYEIKTAGSARGCIRQALAQLLEYSYWPSSGEAKQLVVVGEPALDDEARLYLHNLRIRFGLPVYYQQIDAVAEILSEPG
jgi:hypothetical protein